MTTATPARRPSIPVSVAEEIGRDHDQGIIVILSVGQTGAGTSITTWGRIAGERAIAKQLGEQIAAFVGCDQADGSPRNSADDFYKEDEPAAETSSAADRDAVRILRRLIEEGAIASKHTPAVEEFLLHC